MDVPRAARAALVLALGALASCAAPGAELSTCRAPDGVEIAYDVREARHPAGDASTLVFVHGWCGNRSFWSRQLHAFAEDHRVVSLDLAGHGASSRDRAEWTVPGLAGDVVTVADELGLERMILIGHSMGGQVALEAARRLAGRVRAVVVVDTLHDVESTFPPGFVEGLAQRFEADFAGTMKEFVGAMFQPEADPDVVEWTIDEAAAQPDRRAAVALLRSFETLDVRALLAGAGVPVRAINSSATGPTSLEHGRQVADFDAVVLDHVGHLPQLETPIEFNVALRRMLAALEAPR